MRLTLPQGEGNMRLTLPQGEGNMRLTLPQGEGNKRLSPTGRGEHEAHSHAESGTLDVDSPYLSLGRGRRTQ
ncbi:hypothetical protein Pan216_19700 [Planctomycetes bacterium Pan216]|uniref:Uncharacterized protein n=1 Tax=Kolteria novifilia TaxID=2527975 RepID=A0A518B2G2_9BACT|nr:hypothetical protein Pan216_19700 [Planctomycetes bacterium Pan216]